MSPPIILHFFTSQYNFSKAFPWLPASISSHLPIPQSKDSWKGSPAPTVSAFALLPTGGPGRLCPFPAPSSCPWYLSPGACGLSVPHIGLHAEWAGKVSASLSIRAASSVWITLEPPGERANEHLDSFRWKIWIPMSKRWQTLEQKQQIASCFQCPWLATRLWNFSLEIF